MFKNVFKFKCRPPTGTALGGVLDNRRSLPELTNHRMRPGSDNISWYKKTSICQICFLQFWAISGINQEHLLYRTLTIKLAVDISSHLRYVHVVSNKNFLFRLNISIFCERPCLFRIRFYNRSRPDRFNKCLAYNPPNTPLYDILVHPAERCHDPVIDYYASAKSGFQNRLTKGFFAILLLFKLSFTSGCVV